MRAKQVDNQYARMFSAWYLCEPVSADEPVRPDVSASEYVYVLDFFFQQVLYSYSKY